MTQYSSHHSFDKNLAAKYGIEEAIIIHHFQHWVNFNAQMGNNFIDGRTWTYQTREEIAAHFPYLNEHKVRRITDKLIQLKILKTSNFNKKGFDKTMWYAFENEQMFTIGKNAKWIDENANAGDENATPIPHTIPDPIPFPLPKGKGSCERKKPLDSKRFKIEFKEGSFHGITQEDLKQWSIAFPGADIDKEVARMYVWLRSNPTKANKRNWLKFITTWLGKASDQSSAVDARKGASCASTNESDWGKINTKMFYEARSASEGALDHCFVKNDYLFNKEKPAGSEICIKNINPSTFPQRLCEMAGVDLV